VVIARMTLAAVFLWAAIPKLGDPAAFAQAIDNYRLFPEAWIGPIAVVVPAVELTVAVALLLGLGARGASMVAAVMLLMFTATIAQAIGRGIDTDCGCFGTTTKTEAGWTSLVRNLALLAACALVIISPDVSWPLARPQRDGPRPPAGAA
jgi:uncharacterized membrane protein YphA (DoxX/SURF4 family)